MSLCTTDNRQTQSSVQTANYCWWTVTPCVCILPSWWQPELSYGHVLRCDSYTMQLAHCFMILHDQLVIFHSTNRLNYALAGAPNRSSLPPLKLSSVYKKDTKLAPCRPCTIHCDYPRSRIHKSISKHFKITRASSTTHWKVKLPWQPQ